MNSIKYIFLYILFLTTPLASAADLIINASGRDGINGTNGSSSSSPSFDGSDATRATNGGSAGNISIRLTTLPGNAIGITGTHSARFNLREAGQIKLFANGGHGGHGGNGGNGARGDTGRSGRDATRSSSGENGGPGGRGSNGGDGTSGADGGDAGTITVTVREQDMHLLFVLATPQARAGRGGRRGQNGQGGPGGSGGSGGSSYSWTESYESTCSGSCPDTCSGTRTVSNGNGSSTTVSYTYSCTRSCNVPCTKTRTASNSGGFSGPSGPSGSDGHAFLSDGRNGREGSYRYIVEYNDGRRQEYTRAFDLEIASFQVTSDFRNQFVEPSEQITINAIQIRNRGGMPSPTLTPIRLRAQSRDAHSVNESPSINISESIPAGGSLTVAGPLVTEILATALDGAAQSPTEGPRRQIRVGLSGEIVGINRGLNHPSPIQTLQIQHPVIIARVLGRRSIAPGDDYLFRWAIHNDSQRPIGNQQRRVRFVSSFSFRSGRNNGTFELDVRNAAAEPRPSTAATGLHIQPITEIPGRSRNTTANQRPESSLYQANLTFTSSAQTLDEGVLELTAEIEHPYQPGVWRRAHTTHFRVRVGNPFIQHPNSSVLVVSSPQTTPAELDSWQRLCTLMNRVCDFWDIGVMGPLDLRRNHLAGRYASGAIIILNDLMDLQGEERVPIDAMFRLPPSAEFTRHLRENNIGLFVYDRTGSYRARIAGRVAPTGRTISSPFLISTKSANESQFRSPQHILSSENQTSFAMAFSFNQKLEAFANASRMNQQPAAEAYLNAILADVMIEQVYGAQQNANTLAQLPFLQRMATRGLAPNQLPTSIVPLSRNPILQATLNMLAKIKFWTDTQQSSTRTPTAELLQTVLTTLARHHQAGANAAENSASLVRQYSSYIDGRIEGLRLQTSQREADLVRNDTTRFFTFPRRWRGDYFREAANELILGFIYSRTYTHRQDLFDEVLTNERPAIPAFN